MGVATELEARHGPATGGTGAWALLTASAGLQVGSFSG